MQYINQKNIKLTLIQMAVKKNLLLELLNLMKVTKNYQYLQKEVMILQAGFKIMN